MLARKRKATESLLPTRASKHPRTMNQYRTPRDPPCSPSQSILSRWLVLGHDLAKLSRDTFSFSTKRPEASPSVPIVSKPSSHNDSSELAENLPQDGITQSTRMLSHTSSSSSTDTTGPPRLSFSNNVASASSMSSVSASHPVLSPTETQSKIDEIPSVPSRLSRSSSWESKTTVLPDPSQILKSRDPHQDSSLDDIESSLKKDASVMSDTLRDILQSMKLSQSPSSSPSVKRGIAKSPHERPYRNREHIHAKTHKATVQVERAKDREAMMKTLYKLRKSAGYTSSFSVFRGWFKYREALDLMDRQELLSPSSSLPRWKFGHDAAHRPESFFEGTDSSFMDRALEKAREALNGPRPPKPFIPSLEQRRLTSIALDKELERRRAPKRISLPSSLPPEDEAKVEDLFQKRGVVAKFSREQVNDQDISRLKPGQWLNDEIINFYGQLILSRSEACKENPGVDSSHTRKRPLNIHYFSTFFWSKLKGEGYEKARLAKWTKKFDIFLKDVVLIPINHNNAHWTGAAINFRNKRIESYDSMGMARGTVYKLLREYLDAEHKNKKKKPFDFTGWVDHSLEDTPQQENGYDCGVFTCQFLEALSRGEEDFNFSQKDMKYLRRRMVWEIGNTTLREDP